MESLTARQLSHASHAHRDVPPAVAVKQMMQSSRSRETSQPTHFSGESSSLHDCHRTGNLKDKLPRECFGCHQAQDAHALRLGLRPMVEHNRSRHGTNFTTSIEAAEGIATGISAHDRQVPVQPSALELLKD